VPEVPEGKRRTPGIISRQTNRQVIAATGLAGGGLRICTCRGFWESEQSPERAGGAGTGRQAGFPGQLVILSVPHPEDLDFI
jgi:hypothetical protein